ncbi:hypothetical protein CDAR_43631 [Caerostris darwini]|uniref:Uncharacterized protein n=1 Tax=Caerostris darwini TaxID=1538125 RepID=A0AAV4WH14_9ARAC|nr:hypothetical protein CDAR_43631 [Caerostris darwini]
MTKAQIVSTSRGIARKTLTKPYSPLVLKTPPSPEIKTGGRYISYCGATFESVDGTTRGVYDSHYYPFRAVRLVAPDSITPRSTITGPEVSPSDPGAERGNCHSSPAIAA